VDSATRELTAYYTAAAEAYEKRWAAALRPATAQLLDRLPLGSARHVLDLGAGVGTSLPMLRQRAPAALVIAADRSEGMLGRADSAFPRVVADATQLPFAGGRFDVVVLAFVLFHVPQPAAALDEVRRVLRAGGVVGITTWGQDPASPARQLWIDELNRLDVALSSSTAPHNLWSTPRRSCRPHSTTRASTRRPWTCCPGRIGRPWTSSSPTPPSWAPPPGRSRSWTHRRGRVCSTGSGPASPTCPPTASPPTPK
jgi:ubiquinone/menaquinone biosynthesis C-methylase UbiE